MTVSSVVKHIAFPAAPYARHHVRHHWPQSRPWDNLARANPRKASVDPVEQRLNALRSDVTIVAIELCRSRNAESIGAEATRHDLRSIV
jgi:hypothetical protein